MLHTWYLYVLFGYDVLKSHYCTYNEQSNIAEAVKRDLTVCCALMLLQELQNEFDSKLVLTNFIGTLCHNVLNLELGTGQKTNFLHAVAKFSPLICLTKDLLYDYYLPYKCVPEEIFKYLKNQKVLRDMLLECDSDLNIPLHICAQSNNSYFFNAVYAEKDISISEMFKMLNIRNENFFHCISTENRMLFFEFVNYSDLTTFLDEYLYKHPDDKYMFFLATDTKGRTPFHRTNFPECFLSEFSENIGETAFKQLLSINDEDGNNILHYLTFHEKDSKNLQIEPLEEALNPKRKGEFLLKELDPFYKALTTRNKCNQSPIDLCENHKDCIEQGEHCMLYNKYITIMAKFEFEKEKYEFEMNVYNEILKKWNNN
uniref:Uncharacterized protein n=1 Tax=Lutzomyia longipalpis TaxID=7200 RepID=A0A7G3B5S7_LUTLO